MKAWIVAAVSIVAGVGSGLALARMQYQGENAEASPASGKPATVAQPSQPEGTPVVEVDETYFKFGKMEHKTKLSHSFKFSNRGTAPLKLTKGSTSCKCTLSNLDNDTVPPGGTAIVTLEWRAETGPGPFHQTAVITTNDPVKPHIDLEVDGEIVQSVSVVPASLTVNNIAASGGSSAEAGIYANYRDKFEIRSYRLSWPEYANSFKVVWTPATPEQLKAHEATAGYIVKVTLKPGLPLGLVKQRITLDTDLPDMATIDIPFEGTVVSDISIVGQDWSSSIGLLKLGRITRNEEIKRSLKLLTRGEHRGDVEFKLLKVEPDVLQVKLGERSEISKGAVTAVPLEIVVPRGSRTVNCLGSEQGKYGEILLESNHPDVKQVRLQVMFAVEPE